MAREKNIDQRKWKVLKRKLEQAEKAHVKVGILSSSGGAAKHDESDLAVAEIGKIHEYGAPSEGIPERSFIRATFREQESALGKITARAAKQFVEGKVSLARALDMMGSWGANQVKRKITSGAGIAPKLKPATIKAKGGKTRPLVDHGQLLNSISWEVVDAGTTGRGGYKK